MAEIGSTLREARMRARIDMTEVEVATKIRAKYLRALENEEWDLLPGPIYTKSFLRTYGDYLGLDSRMLVDEFKHRYERPSDHDQHSISSLARDRERRNRPSSRVPPWIPIVAVVVVVVGILYAVGSNSPSNSTTASHSSTTHHPARHPHTVVVHHPAPPKKHRKVSVSMVPTGLVYVCLVNGGGRKLINAQNFNVGQTIPTETARHLLLTLGNNAVDLKVDGRKVPLAASSSAIRLFITPVGVSHISQSQKPTCP
jgi:cytoskeleton protein RodZ